MSEINTTATQQETNGGGNTEPEKTFTQEQVNAIVGERLAKEKAKYADYEELQKKASSYDELQEANKSELEKATERANKLQAQVDSMNKANEIRGIRDKVSTETGVPAALLTGDTEEACKEQAEAIKAFAKPKANYPKVPDGGELNKPLPTNTADKFADWFNQNLTK